MTTQRERIRLAAVRLFTRSGYAATSMKQLAAELEMVPANLYNHYPSKEAILFEVLSSTLTELLAREREIVAQHDDPIAAVRALAYDLVLSDLEDELAAFVGHHGLNGLDGPARERIAAMMADVRGIWLDAVRKGVRSGAFDTPDPKLSTLTILTVCSFTSSWFDPRGKYSAEEVATHAAASVLRSLGHAEPVRPTKAARSRERAGAGTKTGSSGTSTGAATTSTATTSTARARKREG
jgi:AcrR family transcriptional regulator